jgi:TP53 regulating kinase-like protein
MVDATEGLLGIKWIEGKSVKQLLPSGAVEESDGEEVEETSLVADENPLDQFGLSTGSSPHLLFLPLADGQSVFFCFAR